MKTLYIDALRLKSGGGIHHFQKILNFDCFEYFDEIIIYTYANHPFQTKSDKIKFKIEFWSKSLPQSLFFQLFILSTRVKKNKALLLTLDSTTLCRSRNQIIINQDIIGFQTGSLNKFYGFEKIINSLKYNIAKKALSRAKTTIFTTEYAKNQVLQKLPNLQNTFVVYHSAEVNTEKIKTDFKLKQKIKIIYVSPILGYKNHDQVIEAVRLLINSKRNIEILFIGGGEIKLINKLKNRIKVYGLEKNFIFKPFVKKSDVESLISNCDIGVFASSVECFGITILEYMKLGLPFICSDESSMKEIIENPKVLYKNNNIIDLKEKLEMLIDSQDLREEFSSNGRNRSDYFDWEKSTQQLQKIIKNQYEETNL